jgi:hypothetical protein
MSRLAGGLACPLGRRGGCAPGHGAFHPSFHLSGLEFVRITR